MFCEVRDTLKMDICEWFQALFEGTNRASLEGSTCALSPHHNETDLTSVRRKLERDCHI